MNFDWQTIIVMACITWATSVVARRGWRLLRAGRGSAPDSSCSGCGGGCSPDVVRLELPAGDHKA